MLRHTLGQRHRDPGTQHQIGFDTKRLMDYPAVAADQYRRRGASKSEPLHRYRYLGPIVGLVHTDRGLDTIFTQECHQSDG